MATATKKIPYPELTEKERILLPSFCDFTIIPADLVEELQAFAFTAGPDKNIVGIAAINPDSEILRQFAKKRFGDRIQWFLAKPQDIAFALRDHKRNYKIEILELSKTELGNNSDIVEIVDRLLRYALVEKASDVHVEPGKHDISIRFRIDGILQKMLALPKELQPAVVARIKILANLKIDEYRRPQDGRIELDKFPGISFRVSVIPTLYGEKIVLRVLDDSHKGDSIRHLGFSPEDEAVVLRNIAKPFGMIITSGPTGSGKTTTLYELLGALKKDGINISTLEDPVEYALENVNQIQVDPRVGLTFAAGLRSLLRQDPDIIMVGEIRDSETAIMAANAALTGHLVFTTMHTNDAPAALSRFLEMKVEDFVVASTVNLVIAQRLVRKICTRCVTSQKLDELMIKKIGERQDVMKKLEERGQSLDKLAKAEFKIGAGCDACFKTGYQGRVGIFEIMEVTKELQKLIIEHASAERMREAAFESGFHDMINDGLTKVFAGVTTFEEILRTTRNA